MGTIKVVSVRKLEQYLDVIDQGKGIGVSSSNEPNVIVWFLRDANLVFEEPYPADGNPGFAFVDGPKAGIFSRAVRSADGRRMMLEDWHPTGNAGDTWKSVLRAYDKNNPDLKYETTTSPRRAPPRGKGKKKGRRTINNPVIINK